MVESVLKKQAESLLLSALESAFQLKLESSNSLSSQIVYPPDFKLGHVAYACHPLSKQLRKAPQQIATQLADAIRAKGMGPWFAQVDTVNGYLNFFGDLDYLATHLHRLYRSGKMLEHKEGLAQKIMVEHSQLNTHKAFHVGHLRNIVTGDGIARLLKAAGHEVVRAIYPGDLGTHIAKVLWYIQKFKKNEIPSTHQAEWLGECYSEADTYLKSLEGTPAAKETKAEMAVILRQLEDKSGPLMDFYLQSRQWSLDLLKQILKWLDVEFDRWFFESECDRPARDLVLEKYAQGFFVKSDGAIGIDLSECGLGFALFLKSDGTTLYLTKDLELIQKKFSDPALNLSIVVVDNRQSLHFKQVFKTAELMGIRPASDSLHLSYETVTDENGQPCSSRGRTGFRLEVLSQLLSEKIKKDYLETYRGTWSDSEIEETARAIALGALKYGFLKVDPNRMIRFVLDEWVQIEGDTGPYLQYVHARCCGITAKVPREGHSDQTLLATETDQELLLMLERFSNAVYYAAKEYRPSILCSYLYDLSKVFNRFYKECPIKNADNADIKNTRLTLVELTAATLREGLSILGIPAPRKL